MAAIRSHDVDVLLDDFTAVMDLVYSRLRKGAVEISEYEAQIYSMMVEEYQAQIGEELAVLGCSRSVTLTNPTVLANLRQQSRDAAVSIVETFNRDLAYAVEAIKAETTTANRNTFFRRLEEWATAREAWKDDQIAKMARIGAKNFSIKEFGRRNKVEAKAYVGGPRPAAEEECQALIDGEPYDANDLPADFPLHINCPHYWDVRDVEVPMTCDELWVGE